MRYRAFPAVILFMRTSAFLALVLSLLAGSLAGCYKKAPAQAMDTSGVHAVKDALRTETYAFRMETRQAYNNRRFDELERKADELHASRAVFPNGSWKIAQFHDALGCRDDEPESMWQLHDTIHKEWIAAYPGSITARVAHANFFVDYAWHARGSGYAATVNRNGWTLFGERLAKAREILAAARTLPMKDAVWWSVSLTVALGQGWSHNDYDGLMKEAKAYSPVFWGYDTSRAYSLLPRWHGEPGDWEDYALQASLAENGLGAEIYARIVMKLGGYYDNVFAETKASWPKTREGLEAMRKKYPDFHEITNWAAKLAVLAKDYPEASRLFSVLGDSYDPGVWQNAEQFVLFRQQALTGATR